MHICKYGKMLMVSTNALPEARTRTQSLFTGFQRENGPGELWEEVEK